MSDKMIAIIGDGMAGKLAAKACIDNGFTPTIYTDKSPKLGHIGLSLIHDSCGVTIQHQSYSARVLVHDYFDSGDNNPVLMKLCDDMPDKYGWSSDKLIKAYSDKTGSGLNNSLSRDMSKNHSYIPWEEFDFKLSKILKDSNVEVIYLPERFTYSPDEHAEIMEHGFCAIVNTAPANVVFGSDYGDFRKRKLFIKSTRPEEAYGISSFCHDVVLYNLKNMHPATEPTEEHWLKYSRIQGKEWTEYSSHVPGSLPVCKADGNGFDEGKLKELASLRWFNVGRYGTWEAKSMVHSAYYDTCTILSALSMDIL